jgi:hypothetical protein
MPLHPEENPSWEERAVLLIGLKVPQRYGYLITPELIQEGAALLRSGRNFEVRLDEVRLGPGFGAVMAESAGDLPGVSTEGISARGLVTLVPKER